MGSKPRADIPRKNVSNLAANDSVGMVGISKRFAVLNKLITRDLNNNTSTPTFSLYSKDNITE